MAVNKEVIQFSAKGMRKLQGDIKGLERQIRKLDKAYRKSSQGGKGSTKSMGAMIAKLGISYIAFRTLTSAVSGTIRVGKEFEKNMSNVAAISGATGEELKALEINARNLGETTVFSATQVAQLSTEFAKLGFTSKQIQAVTKDTLALAAASGADLATSAAIAGGTLKAFGMNVSETSRVTDTMALSFSSSALDMEKFTNSMQYVGPIAKAAGIGVEGATALLGTLADNMISGSMAGTALRKILLEAGKEGSKLATRMGGPVKSMEDFQEGLRKLKDEGLDIMAEGVDLVGARAVTAFGILIDGVDATDELTESLENSAGAAQRMADIQLDNLAGSMTLLKSATEGLGIALFDNFQAGLRGLVDDITRMVSAFSAFIEIPVSEKLKDEQIQYNALVTTLQRTNINQQTRNTLIQELQKNYGSYIGNIDLETASVKQLSDMQKIANAEFEKKIKLAASEEILKEAYEETLKIQVKLTAAEVELSKRQNEKPAVYQGLSVAIGNTNAGLRGQELVVGDLRKKLEKSKGVYTELDKILTGLGYTVDITTGKIVQHSDKSSSAWEKAKKSMGLFGDEQKAIQDIASANQQIFSENLEFQLMQIGLQVDKFRQMKLDEVAITQFAEDAKRDAVINNLEETSALYNSFLAGYDQFVSTMVDTEMRGAEKIEKIQEAAKNAFIRFLANQLKQYITNQIAQQVIAKTGASVAITSALATGTAIASAYAVSAALASTASFGAAAVSGTAAIVASIAATKAMAIALAEGGEFITKGPQLLLVGEAGKEHVSVTPLEGPSSNIDRPANIININISAPLVDETVIDSIIPAIERAQRLNLA